MSQWWIYLTIVINSSHPCFFSNYETVIHWEELEASFSASTCSIPIFVLRTKMARLLDMVQLGFQNEHFPKTRTKLFGVMISPSLMRTTV